MEQFIKELTELSIKHQIILRGDGVYYHFVAVLCKDLKGMYVICDKNTSEERITWIDL